MSEAQLQPMARLLGRCPPAPAPESAAQAHARGRAEAAAEAAIERARADAAWAEQLRGQRDGIAAALAALEALFAEELAGLALAIAEQVLAATPTLPDGTLRAMVGEALADLGEAELRCPPALADALGHMPGLSVSIDARLPADSIVAARGQRWQMVSVSDQFDAVAAHLAEPGA